MKTRKIASFCIAVAYGLVAVASPVLADNEFDGGAHGGSDGAWGWNPPNHDRFGSNDGMGRGGFFEGADDYGSGGNGGPFGNGGSAFAGRMGLFALLISLISGNNGLVGPQRDRAGFAVMNLMTADSGQPGGSGSSNGSSGDSENGRKPPGRIEAPNDDIFDAP